MISKFKKRIPKWVYNSLLGLIGLLIIIFNDAFGDSEEFAIGAFLYFFLLFFLFLRWLFKQIKANINLKNEKAKTELMHLKSQVSPHFFFNTLNNLYGLVDKDSQRAKTLILKLSDMMRYSIYEGQKETVTLEEEVAYLENYVALHKMRYHKEIDIKFEIDIKEKGLKIMPLLFIMLLENAFKHGVENLIKPYVYISISASQNEIHFTVENNFDAAEQPKEVGIGLQNLKRRLELVYPKNHSLTFQIEKDSYKATLTLDKL